MAKHCLRSTTIPSKKIKQFISDIVGFLLRSFFLLKLLPLLCGPNAASIPEDEDECESGTFKEKINDPVEFSFRENDDFEEAKSSEMEWRSTPSSINRGSHTRMQPPMMISHTLSDLGSMRAEKEWSTKLACKLFQEQNSVVGGGGEGMDKLWEVYETTEEDKQRESHRGEEEEKSKSKNNKSRIVDYLEEFEEEEEGDVGSLCCLKALKLSVGKMNFGMKISKAFKGIRSVGWLNHRHHKKKMKKKKKGL